MLPSRVPVALAPEALVKLVVPPDNNPPTMNCTPDSCVIPAGL